MGNRVVKFRGKRTDNGEWVYGFYVYMGVSRQGTSHLGFAHMILDSSSKDAEGLVQYEVIPETVGQYTGLYDKSGVEIYEGDVVKDGAGQINPIVFLNSTYWFNWLHLIDAIEPWTVIGNIHDKEEAPDERD